MSITFTPQIGDEICAKLAEGKSLVTVCTEMGIKYHHVFEWLRDPENSAFADNYAHARDAQSEYFAEGIIDIADNPVLAADDKRVRIDARKWYAGKMKPKKYGDKTVLAGDPENPLTAASVNLAVTSDLVKSIVQQVRDEF